jgi:hypothetical protein
MMTDKIGLKLFFANGTAPDGHAFIEVFHRWISGSVLTELMIDVADYGHVVGGTSVYFCGHESDYSIDTAGGRPGLLYRRKRAPAPAGSILEDGLARLDDAASKLTREPALKGLEFSRTEIAITLFDRLHAPNEDEAFARLDSESRPIFERFLGGPITFTRASKDARELLGAVVRRSFLAC